MPPSTGRNSSTGRFNLLLSRLCRELTTLSISTANSRRKHPEVGTKPTCSVGDIFIIFLFGVLYCEIVKNLQVFNVPVKSAFASGKPFRNWRCVPPQLQISSPEQQDFMMCLIPYLLILLFGIYCVKFLWPIPLVAALISAIIFIPSFLIVCLKTANFIFSIPIFLFLVFICLANSWCSYFSFDEFFAMFFSVNFIVSSIGVFKNFPW